jgi:hypothetical protein
MAASVPMDDGPSAAVPASWPTGTAGHRTSSGAAEIITDPVWSEEWLAALPKAHPLVRRTKLHATDFDGQNDTLHVNVRTIAEVEHLNIILGARDRQPGGRPGPQPDGAIAVTRCWPPVSSTPTEDASSID